MDRLPSPARKNLLFGNSCSSPSGLYAMLGFLLLPSSFTVGEPVKAGFVCLWTASCRHVSTVQVLQAGSEVRTDVFTRAVIDQIRLRPLVFCEGTQRSSRWFTRLFETV